jgi:hypothetical protein
MVVVLELARWENESMQCCTKLSQPETSPN